MQVDENLETIRLGPSNCLVEVRSLTLDVGLAIGDVVGPLRPLASMAGTVAQIIIPLT